MLQASMSLQCRPQNTHTHTHTHSLSLSLSHTHTHIHLRALYSSLVGLRPLAFLSIELPHGSYDVNVTPDKRSVFVQREVAIMAALEKVWAASIIVLDSTVLLHPSPRLPLCPHKA